MFIAITFNILVANFDLNITYKNLKPSKKTYKKIK